ncbi:MAG: thioredoxin family protein [Acidobacteria bacterium]|nr:thioredoxin family protein [Acidobacteriota bacterium]
MTHRHLLTIAAAAVVAVSHTTIVPLGAQGQVIRAELTYHAPVKDQPKPNFSPKGMQVTLADAPASMTLPAGAVRPAKMGKMKLGPNEAAWVPVLTTATAAFPKDLCQLFIDKNRNGNFTDDGPALTATPTQREKTLDWWSSMSNVELNVPYSTTKATENYFVNFWIVRPNEAPVPDIMRFSVGSWRSGTVKINGVDALVAAMDDNNAIFDKDDMWSVIEASAPDAPKAVLTIGEARGTNRFMFVKNGDKDMVLEFRSFSPDGRFIEFAVVDKPMTKAADRKADDALAAERPRPRTGTPFTWTHNLTEALATAKAQNKKVFIDFETDWCGPCKSMDEWIWTDAEVADALKTGYIGVKLDGDIEKALVKKYTVAGYPTMIALDGTGKELWRAVGYQSSKEVLALFAAKK